MTVAFPRGAAKALLSITKPTPGVYLLSMHNLPDNRLTPSYIKHSLLPALDHIELDWRTSYSNGDKEAALIITGEREKNKFFGNGLNLEQSSEHMGFFRDYYYTLLSRVLTFPIPTIAAINGHAFAGSLPLGLSCDWRLMKAEKAWCCMNELDFGAPLPSALGVLLRARLPPQTVRTMMLSAHRFTAPEALSGGVVDEVVEGDGEATIKRAIELAGSHKKHSASGSLQMMKQLLYADIIEAFGRDEDLDSPHPQNEKRFKALQAAVKRGEIAPLPQDSPGKSKL
ncbi:ClpP/crotonase [Meredithblackwellia eburnea MCA 4105]